MAYRFASGPRPPRRRGARPGAVGPPLEPFVKLADLAAALALPLVPADAGAREIASAGPIESAGPDQLAYVASPRAAGLLATTRAGAVLVAPNLADQSPAPCLVSPAPDAAFARASRLLAPRPRPAPGIAPSAH